MSRWAAHYVYAGCIFPMSIVEFDSFGMLDGIYPLKEELASTIFMHGVLLLIPDDMKSVWQEMVNDHIHRHLPMSYLELLSILHRYMPYKLQYKSRYVLLHLQLNPFSATELSTYDSRCDSYI